MYKQCPVCNARGCEKILHEKDGVLARYGFLYAHLLGPPRVFGRSRFLLIVLLSVIIKNLRAYVQKLKSWRMRLDFLLTQSLRRS